MSTTTVNITGEQLARFKTDGFFFLERVIPDADLEMLREECQISIDKINEQMRLAGSETSGINKIHSRYFITQPSLESERLSAFFKGDLMAEICRATLGDTAYAAWEQYVVKAAESGAKFGWHQDTAYSAKAGVVNMPKAISCWCALDDMSEENGTAYIMPFARYGNGQLMPHVRDEELNDLVGYHGDDPGEPALIPAGSIAVFNCLAFHRSGHNRTNRMRRVYLSQYTDSIARLADGSEFGRAEPFLENGINIAN